MVLTSEIRYRRLFEAARDGILIVDAETGEINDVNPFLIELMGMSREKILKKKVWEIGTFKDIFANKEKFLELQNLGYVRYHNLPLQAVSGRKIQVEFISNVYLEGPRKVIQCNIRDNTERKRAADELRRFKTAIDQVGESIFITDPKGTILFVNPAFEDSTGFRREEVVGKNPRLLKSGKMDKAFYREMWKTISSGHTWKGRITNQHKDGTFHELDEIISPIRDDRGRIVNYVAVKRDVTENIRLEDELRQSQKMESVGRLAGGVAHDFNNLLTAINGFAEYAREGLPEGDQRRNDLTQVLAAGAQAVRLTRQLLAFSRKQVLNPKVLDINAEVGATVNLLKRLIGEDIKIDTRLAEHPCLVKVDAGQIEQVFLNLAINARDAMPTGGTLILETEIVSADEASVSIDPGLQRGPLVCLSVRDTGCGMTDEVKTHLFEPFFTTKEMGKGTGLGLCMVYGIVKQSGGDIKVESSLDHGTTFRIYFSQIEARTQSKDKDEKKDSVLQGNETILLVEDEGLLRDLGKRTLAANGYTVLIAAKGQEALEVLERHGRPVDLLVTDVMLPGMSGRELAQTIAKKRLAHRTLFVSGHADDAIVQHGVLDAGLAFLYKPFSPNAFLRKLRKVLDGPVESAKP